MKYYLRGKTSNDSCNFVSFFIFEMLFGSSDIFSLQNHVIFIFVKIYAFKQKEGCREWCCLSNPTALIMLAAFLLEASLSFVALIMFPLQKMRVAAVNAHRA